MSYLLTDIQNSKEWPFFVFTWKYIVLHKVINTNKDESNGITIILFEYLPDLKENSAIHESVRGENTLLSWELFLKAHT